MKQQNITNDCLRGLFAKRVLNSCLSCLFVKVLECSCCCFVLSCFVEARSNVLLLGGIVSSQFDSLVHLGIEQHVQLRVFYSPSDVLGRHSGNNRRREKRSWRPVRPQWSKTRRREGCIRTRLMFVM